MAIEYGRNVTFSEFATLVAERGVILSRSRWAYMLNGEGPLVRDSRLLQAIADVFDVSYDYLVNGSETMPDVVAPHEEVLRAARIRRVRDHAIRNLTDIAPGELQRVLQALDDPHRD
ncbi:hypothetical protein [Agromyces humi]|uniref:hypothetical protein n=1 Tax=Agromyces humi TaxID=1766800 RepID=UPI001358AABE|nr:hypothetical protein [Agromyces humi]